jgi:hypothetical protein
MNFYDLHRAGPNVKVSFKGLPADDAEFDQFLLEMTGLYDKKTEFTILFDTRGLGMLPMKYLSGLSQWVTTNGPLAKAYMKKSAVLIGNPFVRTFLKALFLISKPSSPLKLCSNLRECLEYLEWDVGKKK